MLGTIINAAAIAAGVSIGLIFKRGITAKIQNTIMQGLGLAVLLIGFKTAWQTENELIPVLSLALGAVVGEYLAIEDKLNKLGGWLESKVGSNHDNVARAFVTASLMYCIGAMAIMGPMEDGLTGKTNILQVKSALDGISAVIFTSTMGIGVVFSVIPVFIYQGSITLLAEYVKIFFTENMITEMNATGGILIIGIGINILGIKKIKVANLLPAVIFAVIFVWLKEIFFNMH
ncbi:putative membrane protein YqgA involved in biofilm formation [Desulfohalotomaculum tongense]|uniref:DUF554 domain-containing protein n=1 Tax=Desulforadius tongensis TaxID=1216062 RepID=UPI001958DEAE|nr:DUF554 domain-containing protein [Desulforadius tongensis]MBM7855809.1 putative membrane protein YqgA involved in biofilm formation [Desulforadius tongensis]